MLQVDTPVGKFRVWFSRKGKKTTVHLVELQGKKKDTPVEIQSETVGCWHEDIYSHFGGRLWAFRKLLRKSPLLQPEKEVRGLDVKFMPTKDVFRARRVARSILWKEFWSKTSKKYVPSRVLSLETE